jgi:dTDP-4-amino-4,6-dideoxygalactose transaminase
LPILAESELHAMHLYVIEYELRDKLLNHLRNKGVGASLHYPHAVHQHPAYDSRIKGYDDLPVTEDFYKRHLTLPMFPELDETQIQLVVNSVQNWFS